MEKYNLKKNLIKIFVIFITFLFNFKTFSEIIQVTTLTNEQNQIVLLEDKHQAKNYVEKSSKEQFAKIQKWLEGIKQETEYLGEWPITDADQFLKLSDEEKKKFISGIRPSNALIFKIHDLALECNLKLKNVNFTFADIRTQSFFLHESTSEKKVPGSLMSLKTFFRQTHEMVKSLEERVNRLPDAFRKKITLSIYDFNKKFCELETNCLLNPLDNFITREQMSDYFERDLGSIGFILMIAERLQNNLPIIIHAGYHHTSDILDFYMKDFGFKKEIICFADRGFTPRNHEILYSKLQKIFFKEENSVSINLRNLIIMNYLKSEQDTVL